MAPDLQSPIDPQHATYQQLKQVHDECQSSLDEFCRVFLEKSADCHRGTADEVVAYLDLTELQAISKEIQALSRRVIDLEDKIELVVQTMCRKANGPKQLMPTVDRKLLPREKMSQSQSAAAASKCRRKTIASGTPFVLSPRGRDSQPCETGSMTPRTDRLLGGSATRSPSLSCPPLPSPSSPPPPVSISSIKEVSANSCSKSLPPVLREREKMKDSSRSRNHSNEQKQKRSERKSPEKEKSATTTAMAAPAAPDSLVKVYELIPELLSKFEEFHRSFNQEFDGTKELEPKTAADIVRVMDQHLRLLESLELKLRSHSKARKVAQNGSKKRK